MKLFRNQRQDSIRSKRLKNYLLYAIGEVFLVMIGILLAFQVNKWNDNIKMQRNENTYYQNLKEQLTNDSLLLSGESNYNNKYLEQFVYAFEILEKEDRTLLDTLGKIAMNLVQYSDFDKQGNIYETLVNSGEIKLLKNTEIINQIRELEENYFYINRMENIHYEAIMDHVIPGVLNNINFSSLKVENPDILYTFKFQNIVILMIYIMREKNECYNSAQSKIQELLASIKEELK